jgi:hypothetical protein
VKFQVNEREQLVEIISDLNIGDLKESEKFVFEKSKRSKAIIFDMN